MSAGRLGFFRVRRRLWPAVIVIVGILAMSRPADAQVRGVYPTGMSATNAGVTPGSGLTYSNLFIFNSRDESKGPDGEVVATGSNAVMIDLNTFVWVSRGTLLGGARFSAAATLLVSNSSLASDTEGQLSAGGGFADFYLQPVILGWTTDRVGIRTAYGLLAPTGRFQAGASDNVGSGYWTHAPSVGLTIFLTRDKTTTLSAFHIYEFHTVQEGTDIHPGPDREPRLLARANVPGQGRHAAATRPDWLWPVADHRQDRAGSQPRRERRALQGQCAGLRVERGAAGAEGEPGPEVLQGILEPVDFSGLFTADRGSGHLLG